MPLDGVGEHSRYFIPTKITVFIINARNNKDLPAPFCQGMKVKLNLVHASRSVFYLSVVMVALKSPFILFIDIYLKVYYDISRGARPLS